MPLIQANGIQIYYEIKGHGETLVVIPGLSIDITALERISSELYQNYQVLALDNRGAGRSDKPRDPYSIEMMADDTAGLLAVLRIERAHVMGISMGGKIAIALTLKHPQIVKSLILVSTSPRVAKTFSRKLTFLILEIPRQIGTLFKKYPQPHYAYNNQRRASQDYDATARLHEIKVPTLILQGKKDRLAPNALAGEMRTEIKGSKLESFNGGHMFFLWKPREFISSVKDFLESVKTVT